MLNDKCAILIQSFFFIDEQDLNNKIDAKDFNNVFENDEHISA